MATICSPESTVARNDRRKIEENLLQGEIQYIEASVNSKEIQANRSFINSIEQENGELKRINTKFADEIIELKLEIQKYKFNEEKLKKVDQGVSYYTCLACFNILMALFNLVKPAIRKGK